MAEPTTWYVDDDGGADFTKIQDAINAASPGDNIFVYNGTYFEHVSVYKDCLTVVGENKNSTIVDGGGTSTVLRVAAMNVTISGFKVQNSGWGSYYSQGSGIYLYHPYKVRGCNISYNIISNCRYGISSWQSINNTISGNIISNTNQGISFDSSDDSTISGNTISNTEQGISFSWSDDNTVVGNVITNSTLGDPYNSGGGVYLEYSSNNTVADNTISNTTEAGILLQQYSHHNTIVGNVISRNTDIEIEDSSGIFFDENTYNNTVINNIISKSHRGIYTAQLSYNNTIIGNTISNLTIYECGINIWGPDNKIIGNTILNMGYVGIQLNSISSDGGYGVPNACANNVVSGNTISNSTFGINLILAAFSNTIAGNNVSNNGLSILISDHSDNNTVINNHVSSNDYGILLFSSNNTKVYHNNFINNADQVLISQSYNTTWDDSYPSGGNYWSDYSGIDFYSGPYQNETTSDGIGDTPYVIDMDNQDNYPLMNPWTPAPPTVVATADVAPSTLNLKSKGKWITCYIELPEGYNVSDIDVSTVILNDSLPVSLLDVPAPEPVPTEIGDYDSDGIPDLMVKFNRTELTAHIYHISGITYGNVTLTITGQLADGTPFEGSYNIKVMFGGDADLNCYVENADFFIWRENFGRTPDQCPPSVYPDFDDNGLVDTSDFFIWRENFGATVPSPP